MRADERAPRLHLLVEEQVTELVRQRDARSPREALGLEKVHQHRGARIERAGAVDAPIEVILRDPHDTDRALSLDDAPHREDRIDPEAQVGSQRPRQAFRGIFVRTQRERSQLWKRPGLHTEQGFDIGDVAHDPKELPEAFMQLRGDELLNRECLPFQARAQRKRQGRTTGLTGQQIIETHPEDARAPVELGCGELAPALLGVQHRAFAELGEASE